jgi:hypothetical protein
MNSTHYDIFKVMEYYFNNPDDFNKGPQTSNSSDGIINNALWFDNHSGNSADLKYYDNGVWKLLFGDRFKLIMHMLDSTEPENPIEGQLWINSSGLLMYYKNGQFVPIKSNLSDVEDSNPLQYQDFLIINPLKYAEHTVMNNFSKFLFAHTPIEEWKPGTLYYYQQGVTYNGELYVCNREHYSSSVITIDNVYYWSRIDSLMQFLVPNTYTDKVFINGKFTPEKVGVVLDDIKKSLYSSFGVTFSYEDTDVVHDSVRFDIVGDGGYYDEAVLVETEGVTPDVVIPTITDDEGYINNTNISLYISNYDLKREKDEDGNYLNTEYYYGKDEDYKLVTAVHVNPTKLDKITKYFIKLDKSKNIVPIPKENTEYYGIKDGIGMLLIESTSDQVFDYCSTIYNNEICIKVTDNVCSKYDYIYALHYNYVSAVKKAGKLYRKKVNLNDDNAIYIGQENPNNVAVFAQGLFFQRDADTYEYNYEDEYIHFKDKLLDSSSQRLDVSIIRFPNVFRGTITIDKYVDSNYITGRGYRVDLNEIPYNTDHCVGFVSGIQVDNQDFFKFFSDDKAAVYFPEFSKDYITKHDEKVEWIIAETDFLQDSLVTEEMFRGKTVSKIINGEVCIEITRDKTKATDDLPYLWYTESPILFVDGVLIFQKDITITENALLVNGLKVGQNVLLLGDTNKDITLDDIITKENIVTNVQNFDSSIALEEDPTKLKLIEDLKSADGSVDILTDFVFEDIKYLHSIFDFSILNLKTSDNMLFEDDVSNVTVRTERNDTTVLYLKSGLICDTDAVITSELKSSGYHGEIKHLFNAVQDKWYMYNADAYMWEEISSTDLPIITSNADGYTSHNNSLSILREIKDEKYCTYFSYVYSDTVEKPLLTGYCLPGGIDKNEIQYKLSVRHSYVPGRNEISVYLNGIRQTLTTPFEKDFAVSTNKECDLDHSNYFVFSNEDGTAINLYDGYYTYKTSKNGFVDYMYKKVELTDTEISNIKATGTSIELVSTPNKNLLFYVIEPCETGESVACQRTILTFEDALSSKGAYANNTYSKSTLNLNKGNIRVFINGLRQPFGAFKDVDGNIIESYKIVDSHTIQVNTPLIGGQGGNLGNNTNPLFPINSADSTNCYEIIDEILIETRVDYDLRELTIPLKYAQTTFTTLDGLPEDLFKTKDTIMIYINGYAYGNNYKNEYETITLQDSYLDNLIDNSGNNFITFEWR